MHWMVNSNIKSITILTLGRLWLHAITSESIGRTLSLQVSSSLVVPTHIQLYHLSCRRTIPLQWVSILSTKPRLMIPPSIGHAMRRLPKLFTPIGWNNFECYRMKLILFLSLIGTTLIINSSFNKHLFMLWEPKLKGSCGINDCVISLSLSLPMPM